MFYLTFSFELTGRQAWFLNGFGIPFYISMLKNDYNQFYIWPLKFFSSYSVSCSLLVTSLLCVVTPITNSNFYRYYSHFNLFSGVVTTYKHKQMYNKSIIPNSISAYHHPSCEECREGRRSIDVNHTFQLKPFIYFSSSRSGSGFSIRPFPRLYGETLLQKTRSS